MTTRMHKRQVDVGQDLHWNINAIVADLRTLRNESLAARKRLENPAKLPSRTVVAGIVESLIAALFPNRLASHPLGNESVDYFVGHTLDKAFRELVEQVVRELQFISDQEAASDEHREQALAIVRRIRRLPAGHQGGVGDGHLCGLRGRPGRQKRRRSAGLLPWHYGRRLSPPGPYAIQPGATLVARIIAEMAHSLTGIDIHPGARIKGSFFIDHGTGVVIGETAVIGEHVRLYHGVTLGAKRFQADEDGSLIKGNARHPIVEDDVVIYAGPRFSAALRSAAVR